MPAKGRRIKTGASKKASPRRSSNATSSISSSVKTKTRGSNAGLSKSSGSTTLSRGCRVPPSSEPAASGRAKKAAQSSKPKVRKAATQPDDPSSFPWASLTIAQLKPELKKRGLKVSGKKDELVERLNEFHSSSSPTDGATNKTPSSTKSNKKAEKKVVEWQNSKAKAYLQVHLQDNGSPFHTMDPEDIYNSYSGFRDYKLCNFKANLTRLKKAIAERKATVAEDERIFELEQKLFPRKDKTSRGDPYWDTHLANESLIEDVRNGNANLMKPSALRKTKAEYQDFDVIVFCKHVHQEKRSQREKPYWIPKRNKDALHKYLKEVEALKSEFDTNHVRFLDEVEEEIGGDKKNGEDGGK